MTELKREQLLQAFAYTARPAGKLKDFFKPRLSRRARRRRRGKYKAAFDLFYRNTRSLNSLKDKS